MNSTKVKAQVDEYTREEIEDSWLEWSCLWWSDFEEAGVERCYLAVIDNDVVGFQTVNGDGLCIAIEIHSDWQSKGIGSQLVEESGCWKPERNECPEFWAKMKELYGW